MKRSLSIMTMLAAGTLLFAVSVRAHHVPGAEFDTSKPVTLHGLITQVEWQNPHAWIHMDVKESNGTVRNWKVQVAPPNSLNHAGIRKTTLKPGIEVTVDVWLAKDGSLLADARQGGTMALGTGERVIIPAFMPDGAKLLAGQKIQWSEDGKTIVLTTGAVERK